VVTLARFKTAYLDEVDVAAWDVVTLVLAALPEVTVPVTEVAALETLPVSELVDWEVVDAAARLGQGCDVSS
jgi:hypothetical protein